MRLRAASATDVGRVRTNNEDQLLVTDTLFAVADGMGGHVGGEVAASIAVEALKAAFQRDPTADGLAEGVRIANKAILERGRQEPDLRGMGTTLTAAAHVEDDNGEHLAVANVGDSRTYLLRDGDLIQLTEDHSHVQELVRTGQISAEEAINHPRRNIVTRVLGLDPELEVDCFRVDPYRNDRLVLASDGLFDELRDEQIAAILRQVADTDEVAKELVRQAKASGGSDNITVVVVDVVDDDDKAVAASAALKDESRLPTQGARDARLREIEDERAAAPESELAEPTFEMPSRRLTLRVVVFLLALLLVLGGAAAAVGFYARGSYFVGVDGDRVAIFKGQPGGLLWFKPTIEERTALPVDDVPASRIDDVRAGKEASSRAAAERYVTLLKEEHDQSVNPTTSTTVPPAAPAAPVTPP